MQEAEAAGVTAVAGVELSTDYQGNEFHLLGLFIEPDAIHIMKKSEYSGTFGDFSSYSDEFDELSDVNAGIDAEDSGDE